MGTKQSKDALGARGKKDVLLFDPDDLVLVEDVASALYDKRVTLPVSESLVLNIMTYGVLEPILVRKNQETGKVEVIAGRQRVKACREANKRLKKQGCEPHRIPATVKRGEPSALMGMMVSENEIREDDTPLGRAEKAARFIDLGRTEDEAAVMLGVSKTSVKNLLALLDAPAVVRKAVEAGSVSVTDGYKLAKLDPDDAAKRVEKLKTEAPRTGKRSSNGKKAREIVNGTSGVRGKKELKEKLEEIQGSEKISENKRMGAEAALLWAMGDDHALEAIL